MARGAKDQLTMIGVDIGKNIFHLIGLDGRFGSKPEVQRGPRNVRSWGKSRSRFRAAEGLLVAISGPPEAQNRCLLCPRKPTFRGPRWTSACDPQQTSKGLAIR